MSDDSLKITKFEMIRAFIRFFTFHKNSITIDNKKTHLAISCILVINLSLRKVVKSEIEKKINYNNSNIEMRVSYVTNYSRVKVICITSSRTTCVSHSFNCLGA